MRGSTFHCCGRVARLGIELAQFVTTGAGHEQAHSGGREWRVRIVAHAAPPLASVRSDALAVMTGAARAASTTSAIWHAVVAIHTGPSLALSGRVRSCASSVFE